MAKVIDLVRKSCLLNNLQLINRETIRTKDIEREIKKCPHGQRIYNYDDRIPINRDCLVSDISRKVGHNLVSYGDISNAMKNCSTHYEHFGALNFPNNLHWYLFLFLVLLCLSKYPN